jgi:hypothetical protein
MVRLTIDKVLEAKLLGEAEPLELCDAGGRVIGHFIPVADASRYAGIGVAGKRSADPSRKSSVISRINRDVYRRVARVGGGRVGGSVVHGEGSRIGDRRGSRYRSKVEGSFRIRG